MAGPLSSQTRGGAWTGSIASRLCLAINVVQPTAPLVIVALGSAADALPSVALAQRTAHRRVMDPGAKGKIVLIP